MKFDDDYFYLFEGMDKNSQIITIEYYLNALCKALL